MTKCDFCPWSENKSGTMVCSWSTGSDYWSCLKAIEKMTATLQIINKQKADS